MQRGPPLPRSGPPAPCSTQTTRCTWHARPCPRVRCTRNWGCPTCSRSGSAPSFATRAARAGASGACAVQAVSSAWPPPCPFSRPRALQVQAPIRHPAVLPGLAPGPLPPHGGRQESGAHHAGGGGGGARAGTGAEGAACPRSPGRKAARGGGPCSRRRWQRGRGRNLRVSEGAPVPAGRALARGPGCRARVQAVRGVRGPGPPHCGPPQQALVPLQ